MAEGVGIRASSYKTYLKIMEARILSTGSSLVRVLASTELRVVETMSFNKSTILFIGINKVTSNTQFENHAVVFPYEISLPFKRRIKSHLTFAGIIRISPYSLR